MFIGFLICECNNIKVFQCCVRVFLFIIILIIFLKWPLLNKRKALVTGPVRISKTC